jgi:hypothetical protein
MNVQSNQRDLEREVRDLDRQEKQNQRRMKARAKIAGKMDDPAWRPGKAIGTDSTTASKLQGAKAQLGYGMHATTACKWQRRVD